MKKIAIRGNEIYKNYSQRFSDIEIQKEPYNYNIVEIDSEYIDCEYSDFVENVFVLDNYKLRKLKENASIELQEIKNWFFENDWKVNKIVIGEWEITDSRWLEYLSERDKKRERQDIINELLNN